MKEKCKGKVWSGWGSHGCQNTGKVEGYCKLHHPANVEARRKARDERWEQEARERRELDALHRRKNEARDALINCALNVVDEVADVEELQEKAHAYKDLWDPKPDGPRGNGIVGRKLGSF